MTYCLGYGLTLLQDEKKSCTSCLRD